MKTFPLSQSDFDSLRSRLLSMGITIPSGTDGTITQNGIKLKYHYDAQRQLLTLSVLRKPWIVPSKVIWDTVGQWITG